MLMQAAFQEAEDTLQQLLTKVHSDPKLRGDAARGVIRGPQLAQVELELRKLACTRQWREGQEGQEGKGQHSERQNSNTAERHTWQPKEEPETQGVEAKGCSGWAKGEQEGQGVQAERQEGTRALAEAVLTYYQQLGHTLSCAVDLR